MIRRVFGLAVLGSIIAGAALAGPPPAKTVTLHTCPVTGEKITGAGVDAETVGKYKISFCCGGCKDQFAKLSKKDQEKKLADIAKKEAKPKS